MLTEQMKKDLANPADVIEIVTSNGACIKAIYDKEENDYKLATAIWDVFSPKEEIDLFAWFYTAQDLRETAAVFNALADTLDKQNGGAND